jgi:hypothetical protein
MKTIGGVGYILSIIPVVSLVSPVLVGIAWYQMGSKTRQGVFKATGVFMIATFLAAVAFLAIFSAIFLPILAAAFAAGGMGVVDPSTLVAPILGSLLAFVGFAIVLVCWGLLSLSSSWFPTLGRRGSTAINGSEGLRGSV